MLRFLQKFGLIWQNDSQGDICQHYKIQHSVELKQNQDSVFTDYCKIKSLWDELTACSQAISCTCGGLKQLNDAKEKVRLGRIFMGLNEPYSGVKGQIMLMQPLSSVKKAYFLCEEEKQRGLVEPNIIEQVHALNLKRANPTTRRPDVIRVWTPRTSTTQGPTKQLHCSYCDVTTHTTNKGYH